MHWGCLRTTSIEGLGMNEWSGTMKISWSMMTSVATALGSMWWTGPAWDFPGSKYKCWPLLAFSIGCYPGYLGGMCLIWLIRCSPWKALFCESCIFRSGILKPPPTAILPAVLDDIINMSGWYITFPHAEGEQANIKMQSAEISVFPNIIWGVDCTHIKKD